MIETVQELAGAIADEIEKYGWQRGRFGTKGGPRCISGHAMTLMGRQWTPMHRIYLQLAAILEVPILSTWNDEQPDAETVVAKLRKIAAS